MRGNHSYTSIFIFLNHKHVEETNVMCCDVVTLYHRSYINLDLFLDDLPVLAGLLRHRYVICLLVFTGLALAYSMRINMSVAIIQMVGSKGKNVSSADDGTCLPSGNISVAPKPVY